MGMTLLNIATLRSIQNCYDFERFRIRFNIIDKKLEEVERRYSPEFATFLHENLIENEK